MEKTKCTAETIKVSVLDTDKMSRDFTDLIRKSKPGDKKTYRTGGKLALIQDPILAIIDDEFIGGQLTGTAVIRVWGEDKETHTFDCLPSYEFKVTIDKLKGYIKEEATLAEFTKGRRGYNSRIIGNEREWMKLFNS